MRARAREKVSPVLAFDEAERVATRELDRVGRKSGTDRGSCSAIDIETRAISCLTCGAAGSDPRRGGEQLAASSPTVAWDEDGQCRRPAPIRRT